MLSDAGYDNDKSSECVHEAMKDGTLIVYTWLSGDQYDPTGTKVVFERTDWAGNAAWAALLTGTVKSPLDGNNIHYVSVFVDEVDAQDWIDSLTGRKDNIKGKTDCQSWLVDLMKAGPKTKNRKAYLKDAQNKFSVSVRSFKKAWKAAIAETGKMAWSKPGRRS